MAEEFEASPRSSKRRRTGNYNLDRTERKSPERHSALSNVSNAWSTISKRLFSRGRRETEENTNDDSAYASKEDSLNEDDIVAPREELMESSQAEDEDVMEPAEQSNKSRTAETAVRSSNVVEPPMIAGGDKIRSSSRQKNKVASQVSSPNAGEGRQNQLQKQRAQEEVDTSQRHTDPRNLSGNEGSRRAVEKRRSRDVEGPVKQPRQTPKRDKGQMQKTEDLNRGTEKSVGDHNSEDEADPQPRSSGRERRRPRRFSDTTKSEAKLKPTTKTARDLGDARAPDALQQKAVSPKPKGILTPSKQKRDGPRRSVVFDESEKRIEEQLGFKDISTSVKKARKGDTHINEPVSEAIPISSVPLSNPAIEKAATVPLEPPNQLTEIEDDLFSEQTYSAQILEELKLPTQGKPFPTGEVDDDSHLTCIKKEILSRLTSKSISPVEHLSTQYTTLHTLLSSTITAGESNSLLLLGSRGSGKSLLVKASLADLTSKHPNVFHVVHLNGFFQTDDKLALREIWRQLGREMQISEDETGEVSSYADTMASLLSLLSHPEEIAEFNTDVMEVDGQRTAKSVIFVLEEFDLFTTHPRQTLLYNLFDIAQSRKAPIAVVGCSTRMDVVDCLEKRVKSRFSHRWLHVPTMKNPAAFQEVVTGILCLAESGQEALGLSKLDLAWRARWNDHIKSSFLPSPAAQSLIREIFYTTKSIPDLLSALYIHIATLTLQLDLETSTTIQSTTPPVVTVFNPPQPSLQRILPDLPLLHLSLLISAARLDAIHNLAALNFNLVYTHYGELVARSRLQRSAAGMMVASGSGLRLWGRETARMAWEELGLWEVVVPVAGLGGKGDESVGDGGSGGGGGGARMWRVDVSLDEVAWATRKKLGDMGVGEILGRWCREIVF